MPTEIASAKPARPPEVFALNTATTNAELMVYCRDLGYLDAAKSTLDATWGLGRFWTLWKPDLLIGNDLVAAKAHNLRSSFTALPFRDRSIPNVVFDPPYKMGGQAGSHPSDEGYGVAVQATPAERLGLIGEGCVETMRVASERVFVKSQDQVVSGDVAWQTDLITSLFTGAGWLKEDALFLRNKIGQPKRGHCGRCGEHYVLTTAHGWKSVRRKLAPTACADGCDIEESPQQHARRNYSTLLVFRRTTLADDIGAQRAT